MQDLLSLDQNLAVFLNHWANQNIVVNRLTVFFAVWAIVLLILLFLVELARKRWVYFLPAYLGVVTSWSIEQIISFFTPRPRPFVELSTKITLLIGQNADSSFPSDHAVVAFACATTLSLFLKQWWMTLLLYLTAFLIGFSRITAGVHYPSDVIVGAIVGVLVSYLWFKEMIRLDGQIEKKHKLDYKI